MSLGNVRIVLVGPLYGGNVGSTCRAMANCGMHELSIVEPRPLNMEEARKMACHAGDILDRRSQHPTLQEATADCGLIVGTSARTGLYRQHAQKPREIASTVLDVATTSKVAYVFGREDKGLSNDELALCNHIVQIPTADAYTSINLAQAVLICCHELFVASDTYEPPEEKSPPVPAATRERMYTIWRDLMLEIGFMEEDKADHMMQGFRRALDRGVWSDDDARILMGVARQAEWASRTGNGKLPLTD